MLPNLGGLGLRHPCVPTMVNFDEAQEPRCEICLSALHLTVGSGAYDPRLGQDEFQNDPTEVTRWSWDTAVLRCGHRFHRRCLAMHFGPGGIGAGQTPRRCPGDALHAPNPSPPISAADSADINADIAAQLTEDSPLNAMEHQRHELARNAMDPNAGVVARVMNTEALQAQKAEAQENARRANARLDELQKDLDAVKQELEEKQKEYDELHERNARMARQPPASGSQSVGPLNATEREHTLRQEINRLKTHIEDVQMTMDDAMTRWHQEKDAMLAANMRTADDNARVYNETVERLTEENRQARAQTVQYQFSAAESENELRHMREEQKRLIASIRVLTRQLEEDEVEVEQLPYVEEERDRLQQDLEASLAKMQKFKESAKVQAQKFKAVAEEKMAKLEKELEAMSLAKGKSPAPAPAPASNPEVDRFKQREELRAQQKEANRPKTPYEEAQERKKKAKEKPKETEKERRDREEVEFHVAQMKREEEERKKDEEAIATLKQRREREAEEARKAVEEQRKTKEREQKQAAEREKTRREEEQKRAAEREQKKRAAASASSSEPSAQTPVPAPQAAGEWDVSLYDSDDEATTSSYESLEALILQQRNMTDMGREANARVLQVLEEAHDQVRRHYPNRLRQFEQTFYEDRRRLLIYANVRARTAPGDQNRALPSYARTIMEFTGAMDKALREFQRLGSPPPLQRDTQWLGNTATSIISGPSVRVKELIAIGHNAPEEIGFWLNGNWKDLWLALVNAEEIHKMIHRIISPKLSSLMPLSRSVAENQRLVNLHHAMERIFRLVEGYTAALARLLALHLPAELFSLLVKGNYPNQPDLKWLPWPPS